MIFASECAERREWCMALGRRQARRWWREARRRRCAALCARRDERAALRHAMRWCKGGAVQCAGVRGMQVIMRSARQTRSERGGAK